MHERKLSGNMLQRYLIHREKKKLILENNLVFSFILRLALYTTVVAKRDHCYTSYFVFLCESNIQVLKQNPRNEQ